MPNPSTLIPAEEGRATAAPPPEPAGGDRPEPVADATRKYLAAGRWAFPPIPDAYRSLPFFIDDLTFEQGDVYEKMALDPRVNSSFQTLKEGILSEGVQVVPARKPKATGEGSDDPDVALAAELAEFVERSFARLRPSLVETLYALLDGMVFGNKLAEQTYRLATEGADRGKLVLDSLVPKPRRSWAFVVDPYLQVVGILAQTAYGGFPAGPAAAGRDATDPRLLPRAKFAIFTWQARDSDPRGSSILRQAYNAWNLKLQLWPEYFKHLTQFAGASIVAKVAREAQPRIDPNTGAYIDAHADMLNSVVQFRNGGAMIIPADADVEVMKPAGEGQPFINAFDLLNREIVFAILQNTRTTMEAVHGSKADSQTGQDVTGLVVRMGRRALEAVVRSDIAWNLVALNYGPEVADRLCPEITLGGTEHQDQSALMDATANLARANWFETDEQRAEMDARLGLPIRDLEAIRKQRDEARQVQQEQAAAQAKALAAAAAAKAQPPGAGGPAGDQPPADGTSGGNAGKTRFAEFKGAETDPDE